MKVCIVTVYNSINSGSYLQAKALGTYFKNKGCQVCYLERPNELNSSSNIFTQIRKVLSLLVKNGYKAASIRVKTIRSFKKIIKEFNVIKKKNLAKEQIDLFVLGSDTIWNLEDDYFQKNYKLYWGGLFDGKKTISYAPSLANTNYELILKYPEIKEYLNNMKAISVRDKATYDIVKKITNRKIDVVCDPTFLLTKEDYKKEIGNKLNDNYIFVYLFSNLNSSLVQKIKDFAKSRNLKIISGTNNYNWCDDCVINNPINFMNSIYYADYVITDTFHGTIFSINFEKQFIVLNKKKNKVNELLKNFNFEDRLFEENSNIEILDEKIDYKLRNKPLKEHREASFNYLNEVIKK